MEQEIAAKIVELQSLSTLWSIGASIASIVLAIVAIVLVVYFYTQSKKTEKDVATSLSKIESHADTLGKITGRQLDRLTKHVTERRTSDNHPDFQALAELATTITKGVAQSLQAPQGQQNATNHPETLKYIIGSYYYSGIANYYAFLNMPAASDYDETNTFHLLNKNVLDVSHSDVQFLRNILTNIKRQDIEATGVAHLFDEAERDWGPRAKDAANSFAAIEQLDSST